MGAASSGAGSATKTASSASTKSSSSSSKPSTAASGAKASSSSASSSSSKPAAASQAPKTSTGSTASLASGASSSSRSAAPASTRSLASSEGSSSSSSSSSSSKPRTASSGASMVSSSGTSTRRAQEAAMDSLAGLESILPEIMARPDRTTGLGPGATLDDLQAFRSSGGLDGVSRQIRVNPTALNMWDQFWKDQNDYRQNKIDERAAAGVVPSEGIIDWNAIRYDLNAPYRDRIQRELESKVPFDPLQVVKDEHERRLAEVAARTNIPNWVAQARADRTADTSTGPTFQEGMLDRGLGPDYQPRLPGAENQQRVRLSSGEYVDTPAAAAIPALAPGGIDVAASSYPAWVSKAKGDFYNAYGMMPGEVPGNLPGQVEGGLDTAVTAKIEEPSVWDKVVEGGGKVLENTTLGGVVAALFPDIWEAGGQMMKGKGGGLRGTASPDDEPSWFEQITDPMYVPRDDRSWQSLAANTDSPTPVVPPGPTIPTTPTTPTTPGTGGSLPIYDRFGNVVFPDMPPYNPGVDPEWLYFRKKAAGMANGGIVGYAEGGEVSPTAGMDPRVNIIADAEDAIEGDSPDPQAALEKFVKTFGEEALTSLVAQVRAGMKMRQRGRMVRGPGGPKDDMVPAMTDDGQPVALSNGEFVMPVEAVQGAGGPEKMQQMSDMLQQQAGGQ